MARGIQLECCKNGCTTFEQELLSDNLNERASRPAFILRRREIKHRLSRVFGDGSHNQGQTAGVTGVGPQLSTALEVYLSLKGAGRPKTFEAGARRAVGYLLEVSTDKPIDTYVRADANALREYLNQVPSQFLPFPPKGHGHPLNNSGQPFVRNDLSRSLLL